MYFLVSFRVLALFVPNVVFLKGKNNGACGNRHTPLVAMKYNRQNGAGNPLEVGWGGGRATGRLGGRWGIERGRLGFPLLQYVEVVLRNKFRGHEVFRFRDSRATTVTDL